jgi:hypothetical protein
VKRTSNFKEPQRKSACPYRVGADQKTKTVPLLANRRGGARGRSLAQDRKEPVAARDIDITRSPSSALDRVSSAALRVTTATAMR